MKKVKLGLAVAFWFFISSTVLFSQRLERRVIEHKLKNGLKVLMLERHQSPTAALYMIFKVGSVDEEVGKSGLAHLFEHLMFKGTKTIGTKNYQKERRVLEEIERLAVALMDEKAKGEKADKQKIEKLQAALKAKQEEARKWMLKEEYQEIYTKNGAVGLNAGTGTDFTIYTVSLPSNKLELWMMMESERIAHPVLREFYEERDVVMEERRLGIETQPGGKLWEQFLSSCFIAHPYGKPIIGWMSDLENLSRKEAEEFFRLHYAPNNAVVAIVGDINPPEVIRLMEKYFGKIPAQPTPPPVRTVEPEQVGERIVEVEFEAQPQILIGYHKPNLPHPDDYVFEVIEGLLSRGRTSRLYKNLIEGKEVAVSAWGGNGIPGSRYPNLFVFGAAPRHPHTVQEVLEAIYAEIEKLKTEPVQEQELQKIRNQIEADFIRSLASNEGMAGQLCQIECLAGTWRYILEYRKRIKQVTKEDIMRVANKYFTKNNRTVAILVPKKRA